MIKKLKRFEKMPRGYGLAYQELMIDQYVIALIPLNLIISWFRVAYLSLITQRDWLGKIERQAFDAGVKWQKRNL